MFRHVALFRCADGVSKDQIQVVVDELRKLPAVIKELRAYHVGPDAGISEGNYDFAVVADFDDQDAFLRYRNHPAHQDVLENHIRPIMSGRAATQYEIK